MIYRLDGHTFIEHQRILTKGVRDLESWVAGGVTYLAVANHYDDSGYNINSKVYKWSGTSFVEFQTIATSKAIDWESFKIGDEMYLIEKGEVEVDIDANTSVMLAHGSYFGEIAFLEPETPRTATIRASVKTTLLMLSRYMYVHAS